LGKERIGRAEEKIGLKNLSPGLGEDFSGKAEEKISRGKHFPGMAEDFSGQKNGFPGKHSWGDGLPRPP